MDTMAKIKLAAVLGLGILAVVAARKASAAAGQAVDAAAAAAWAVSPTNNNNVIYQTANWATGGTPDSSLGSRWYDFWNPEPLAPPKPRPNYSDPAKPLTNSDGYDFSNLSG